MTTSQNTSTGIIEQTIGETRQRLLSHPIYASVDRIEHLQIFMKNHVFAVWDFMSLLKRLQKDVAGCDLPWLPPADANLARFVNEVILGEECDEDGQGGYTSHYELYLDAMTEVEADRKPVETFLRNLQAGMNPQSAFQDIDIPERTRKFVEYNLQLAETGRLHEVAAAFCYGREDVIPEMFSQLVETLNSQGHSVERLMYYLKRHIELDGDHHGPLAQRLVLSLCGENRQKLQEAAESARKAIELRIQLWDGVLESINNSSRHAA
ncbi:MAG: DUF3050 domain-containing protein [Planctomycetes bacterium]|nr:DUF3050 domain-containing protein [Planctomycetota bacterium]